MTPVPSHQGQHPWTPQYIQHQLQTLYEKLRALEARQRAEKLQATEATRLHDRMVTDAACRIASHTALFSSERLAAIDSREPRVCTPAELKPINAWLDTHFGVVLGQRLAQDFVARTVEAEREAELEDDELEL